MMRSKQVSVLAVIGAAVLLASPAQASEPLASCQVEVMVLGIAQDGGIPQIGNPADPAWKDPKQVRLATSLALLDHRQSQRYLFEATPDLRAQLQRLDEYMPWTGAGLGIGGIFLTHAHIGHYAGLIFLGHESAGASKVPVYAMPRMRAFLSENGPWDQLVRFENITLESLANDESTPLGDALSVTPHRVPHRDEYSETVGYSIQGPKKSLLFIPDIDSWDRWEAEFGITIEAMIAEHEVAYLDATFYNNKELPGRDMSAFPHPRIAVSMDRFDALPERDRSKVRFIHLNHSNPARAADSVESLQVIERGYRVAVEGERVCLS